MTRRTSTADEAHRHADDTATVRPPANGHQSEHQSLSKYIQARFDECSRSQKDVAQYIVDHLDEAAFQTAEELARRANTSSSTVVRFSQALGFEGFPELQAAAREEYRRVHARAAEPAGARAPSSNGSTPLFSLDQNEFETALAGRSPERRGDRAQGLAQLRRGADRGDRRAPRRCSSPAPTRWPSSPATCAIC